MAGKFVAVLFLLANVFVSLAGANEMSRINPSSSITPAPSPTGGHPSINLTARKFGGHPASSMGSAAAGAQGSEELHGGEQGQDIYLEKKYHHRNAHEIDRSVAGAGVILGGLATAFLVAVFCYIRATGRKGSQSNLLEK